MADWDEAADIGGNDSCEGGEDDETACSSS